VVSNNVRIVELSQNIDFGHQELLFFLWECEIVNA
jgi:hypothetical protein